MGEEYLNGGPFTLYYIAFKVTKSPDYYRMGIGMDHELVLRKTKIQGTKSASMSTYKIRV